MPTLENCLTSYLQIDRSPKTNRSYGACLWRMANAIGKKRDVRLISFPDLADYTAQLHDTIGQGSFHQYVRIIKTFFNWCVKTKYIAESPASPLHARKPRRDPSHSRAIPPDDLALMLQASQARPRDYAILLFLSDTGCRIGGLKSLTLKRLDLDGQTAILLEKGSKWHRVYFGDKTADALRHWLKLRPAVSHDYVWTANDGHPLKREALAAMITRLSKRVIGKTYGPHSIRHAVGHALAKRGVPVTITQRKLGHADPRVTMEIYYPDDDHYVEEISRKHALAALENLDEKQPSKIIKMPLRRLSK
jgi:integrase/recombinase XerC